MKAIVAITLALVASTVLVHVGALTISNLEPKLDVSGKLVNAHDGSYRRFGKYWYYHGAQWVFGWCMAHSLTTFQHPLAPEQPRTYSYLNEPNFLAQIRRVSRASQERV